MINDTDVWRNCDNCGDWMRGHKRPALAYCDGCRFEPGDHVDVRHAGTGDWMNTNTQVVTGILVAAYKPGDDVLMEVCGQRVQYPAVKVFDVLRKSPQTEGWF